jgi:multidrug efflux system membrane fusion protein
VHSRVDGELTDIAFVEGQDVHAGQVLARIDPRIYQAQYDQAVASKAKDEAQLADARLDLQRYMNLGNRVSGQTLDTQRATVKQLEAAVRVDQANIDNAKTMLGYCTITSPIDGRTGIRQVDKGNIVHASDANGIVVITQLQPISVIFTLPQQTLPMIARHMNDETKLPVFAVAADNKTQLDQGKLQLIDNQIDPATGTIKLKSTFPNADHLLWPGGFVNVRLLVDTHHDATVVPAVSIQRGPQGTYVYVLKPDNTVELRPVSVAMIADTDAMIQSGVAPGEKVIVDGMSRLQNGSAVTTGTPNQSAATTAPQKPAQHPKQQ